MMCRKNTLQALSFSSKSFDIDQEKSLWLASGVGCGRRWVQLLGFRADPGRDICSRFLMNVVLQLRHRLHRMALPSILV